MRSSMSAGGRRRRIISNMSKKAFFVMLYCLAGAGLLMAGVGLFVPTKTVKAICGVLAITFLLSVAIQLVLVKRNPQWFGEKKPGYKNL